MPLRQRSHKIKLFVLAATALFSFALANLYPILLPNFYPEFFKDLLFSIAIAFVGGLVVFFSESKIESFLAVGPRVTLIENNDRCESLSQLVQKDSNVDLYTTRFSTRPIGEAKKSLAFTNALSSRINRATSRTTRIISIDYDKTARDTKKKHLIDLLTENGSDEKLRLCVKKKNSKHDSPFDLMILESKFVCIGIEGASSSENYWILIEDEAISSKFRVF